jgi:small subunit ribosomal protein S18
MQLFKRRRKLDPFTEDPTKSIDYRDAAMLSKFVSERGRILSRRLTGLTSYNQRKMSKAIKRAQSLGLMPFTTVQG